MRSFYFFVLIALFSKALLACSCPLLTYFAGFLSQISDRGPQVIRGHAHAFFPDAIRATKKFMRQYNNLHLFESFDYLAARGLARLCALALPENASDENGRSGCRTHGP